MTNEIMASKIQELMENGTLEVKCGTNAYTYGAVSNFIEPTIRNLTENPEAGEFRVYSIGLSETNYFNARVKAIKAVLIDEGYKVTVSTTGKDTTSTRRSNGRGKASYSGSYKERVIKYVKK